MWQWLVVVVEPRSGKLVAAAGKASPSTETTAAPAETKTAAEKPTPPAPKTFTTRPVSPSKPYAAITGAKEPLVSVSTSATSTTAAATATEEVKDKPTVAADTTTTPMVQKTQSTSSKAAVKSGQKKVNYDLFHFVY